MKNNLLVFIAIIYTNCIFSMCTSSGISIWPKSEKISKNSIFIIEGYALSETIINKLNNGYKIYLKSENTKIPFEILKINKGYLRLTQAILKPKSELISGKYYTLEIDGLTQEEKSELTTEKHKWLVVESIDNENPKWTKEPIFLDKQKKQYGCGPSYSVNFCFCADENSEIAIITKLKELKTGKIYDYYVLPNSNKIIIGHGMCSGEFGFIDNEKYEVSFSLIDASGNTDNKFTQIINFISPKDGDDNKTEKNCDCEIDIKKIKNSEFPILKILIIIITLSLFSVFSFYYYKRRKGNS